MTKEQIKAIIKQYADKGKTQYRECCDDNESASLINYWDGYRDCAYNLLRELDDMQEEPVSEDLVSVVEEYAKKHSVLLGFDCDSEPIETGVDIKKAVIYGANWQKEQLLAKAVDGVVHHLEKCGVASVHYTDPIGAPMAYYISPEGLSAGDKVKIIVIKEN